MCRLALMDNAGIRYMQETHGLVDLFDHLEKQLGGHGNGICFIYNNGSYSIKKGLDLKNEQIAEEIMEKIDELRWIIYHTRLAGAASVIDGNCHPFEDNGRVMAMNGNETDYTVVDSSLTDTENILRTTPNITEGTKKYKSAFIGYENGKVFANKNICDLECIIGKNGGIVFASRFPLRYSENETVYEAPPNFIEGEQFPLKLSKTEVEFCYGNEKIPYTFRNGELGGVLTEITDVTSIGTEAAKVAPAEIVVTTSGAVLPGRNMPQTVMCLVAAEAAVKQNGVIIILGNGDIDAGYLQSQELLRVLEKARVICVSEMDDAIVGKLNMIPAADIHDAFAKARSLVEKEEPKIIAIPDGASVVSTTN
ncbi:MAG: hypothetical protein IKU65_06340 [Oscillospiraceae bacterium]|nr:hypothetical protein [Oscillospiraceae bacterium]